MRLWEIREGYEPEEMRYGERGGHDELREAYEEGCEHGYRKAMKEVSGGYGRHGSMGYRDVDSDRQRGGMGQSGRYGERMFLPPYVNYRNEDDDDYMGERRRRDSRGRYM